MYPFRDVLIELAVMRNENFVNYCVYVCSQLPKFDFRAQVPLNAVKSAENNWPLGMGVTRDVGRNFLNSSSNPAKSWRYHGGRTERKSD